MPGLCPVAGGVCGGCRGRGLPGVCAVRVACYQGCRGCARFQCCRGCARLPVVCVGVAGGLG